LKTSSTRFLRIRNSGHFTPRLVSLFAWAALHAIAAFPPQNKYTGGAFIYQKDLTGCWSNDTIRLHVGPGLRAAQLHERGEALLLPHHCAAPAALHV
jgi:hypothetical protein